MPQENNEKLRRKEFGEVILGDDVSGRNLLLQFRQR
jgi:hypothetical protein